MEYRTLGGTGLQVSTHCLGTMMFGAWGNTDVDDCVGTINAAIDGGINFVDTADVYSAGESEEIVGQGAEGPARRGDPRHQGARPDGSGTQRRGELARLDHEGGREQPPPPRHRSHRPVSDPSSRGRHGRRGDARRADRSAAPGQDPLLRVLDVPGVADGRSAVDGRAARALAVPHRAAAVLDLRAADRARRAPGRRAVRDGRARLEPAVSRMADRAVSPRRVRSVAGVARGPWGAARRLARGALRRVASRGPAEVRPGRGADARRRQGGHLADAHGDRVHARAPGGHVDHHRPADAGAARRPARRRPTCGWTPRRWTRSTSSCRPAPSSTRKTAGSTRGGSRPRRDAEPDRQRRL